MSLGSHLRKSNSQDRDSRLQRAQVYFSSAGDANLFVWIDEAEQAKRLQAFLRGKLFLCLERCLGNRMKKVDRNGFDIHGSESQR